MVYSRLGDVLRARHLTVDDPQRQIAARFGLAVDTRTLNRMTRTERVRRPDLELAAAAALDVSLNDVFAVETAPANDGDPPPDGLVDAEARYTVSGGSPYMHGVIEVGASRERCKDCLHACQIGGVTLTTSIA